jgi:outer membrane protein assembly factor BamE (lipoprotein component of BamABCDE complex)
VIELTLNPHDGIEIQSIGKVRFGQTPDEVEKMLGTPAFKDDI